MMQGIASVVLLALLGVIPPRQLAPGSSDVVVVYSGEGDAVRNVVSGVRKRLGERGISATREVRLSDAAALEGLRERRPSAFVTVGSEATERVRRDFSSVPAVPVLVPRAEAAGGPAGVTMEIPWETQVQMLRKLLPGSIKRVGVVYSPANERLVHRLSELARTANLRIIAKPAATPGDIPQALSALASSADVLWGIPDDVVMTPETARSILLFSMRNRIPLIGQSTAWAKAGALLALDRDYMDMGAQSVDQALRLASGEAAASVRSEAPRRVLYAVNRRTAEALGVNLDPDVLKGAQEVFR